MNSIEVRNLSKKFGSFTSVDNISFSVKSGEIFGFLGANGAGKSTTIKMLCGILEPTSGDADVGGFSIITETDNVKKNIGYMSQKFSLYGDLTVNENINFFGGVYGLDGDDLDQRKKWVLEIAGLEDNVNSLTSSLSVGYKQRLALGCAVIHEPEIVFLDEPTGGVDPISRKRFWDLINDLSEKGTTIFVTTHYLDEAEFCNRIILINAGKLVAEGSPKELKKEYVRNPVFRVQCTGIHAAIDILGMEKFTESVSVFGNAIHLVVKEKFRDDFNSEDKAFLMVSSAFDKHKDIQLEMIDEIQPSLEDVFLYLMEHTNKNA